MKHGFLITLKVLVPYEPTDLDSIGKAAGKAKHMTDPSQFKAETGVEFVSAKSEPFRGRDKG
jgi:hypothetical protein